ncbi:MAG: hypothetical protein KHY89_05720 [Butyricicoccus pullicaecorum]|nr:hypothetical protein [Butyricicoccus pullicaecorum]
MKKTTIIPTVSVLIALVCAALFCLNWNPEPLLKGKEQPITQSDIEQNLITDFNGFPAGEDIPRLTGAEDFSEIIYLSDYVTAEPVGIVETGISSLKPWEDHYYTQRVKGRVTGRRIRRPEITSSGWDLLGSYQPYYLLELPDHTYIVAQIPQETAKAIERGKSVTFPIGQKVSMTNAARNELSTICEEYGADMDGVFYAVNDKWQEEYQFILFLSRFGVAALLWFVLAVGLTLAGWKLFKSEEA